MKKFDTWVFRRKPKSARGPEGWVRLLASSISGSPLRLTPNIGLGTERYPERVARRLRATNITAWLAAAGTAVFALKRPDDPDWITVATALALAVTPLLHRFGSLVAPLAVVALVYAHVFRIVHAVGTGDGIFLAYLTAAPLSILLFGIERAWIAAALATLGAVLATVLQAIVPHDTGILPAKVLLLNFTLNFLLNAGILFAVVLYAVRQAARAEAAAEREHARSESLLTNILPRRVAERLKDRTAEVAEAYSEASVLIADVAGYTALASELTPRELVRFLNGLYTRLDALVDSHGLEKIKTSGDAYMVVSGVPEARPDHAAAIADLALDFRAALVGLEDHRGRKVPVRIGIASGPLVAGVVGTRRFFYDVWGDAVNTASRMESTGVAGKIHVAPRTRELLPDRFQCEERGVMEVRGKGPMLTWFLIDRRPRLQFDAGVGPVPA